MFPAKWDRIGPCKSLGRAVPFSFLSPRLLQASPLVSSCAPSCIKLIKMLALRNEWWQFLEHIQPHFHDTSSLDRTNEVDVLPVIDYLWWCFWHGKKRTRSRQIPSYHDPLRLVKKNILLNMAYMSIILLLETVVNPMLRIQPNLARLSNQSQRRPGCGACYTIIFYRIFTVLFCCFILFYFFFFWSWRAYTGVIRKEKRFHERACKIISQRLENLCYVLVALSASTFKPRRICLCSRPLDLTKKAAIRCVQVYFSESGEKLVISFERVN